jgi:NADH-ubiquinone oxidoreductase chain 5
MYFFITLYCLIRMYLLPIWFSFFSFLIVALCGRALGSRGSFFFASSCIFFCLASSSYIFYEVCICNTICYVRLCDWLAIDLVNIHWGFLFDSLSSSMLIVINTISLCAHIYSVEYMATDPHRERFVSYLSLFTFFMILLVLSDNVLQLFVGWEGVGICSYLLISFWYTRIQANKASLLAVMANKIGDIALLISCVTLQLLYKSLDFSTIFAGVEALLLYDNNICTIDILRDQFFFYINMLFTDFLLSEACNSELLVFLNNCKDTGYNMLLFTDYNTVICFFLIIASIGKSAQAGLHIWLPEAMEGPTPVSSLIHAATMVTAGIFLLLRFSYVFDSMNTFFALLILVGSITAFFSSTIGLLQTDIKKVVAYSTCSQLGYMFVCCGFSAYSNSMFHLFNHAFFKALLFLTAGYVIHALNNEQDIRKMGSLLKLLPFSYMMMLIGSLSLIGFPFFSGFFSKDKIIELCFNNFIGLFDVLFVYKFVLFAQSLCICAVIFTLIYSTKMFFYIFLNSFCGFRTYISNIHFSSLHTLLPLFFLSICSISSGYVTSDMMVGVGSAFWLKSLSLDSFFFYAELHTVQLKFAYLLHTEFVHYIRQITLFWTCYFVCISLILLTCCNYFFFNFFIGCIIWLKQLSVIIGKKYLFINRSILRTVFTRCMTFSYYIFYRFIDKGVLEFIGPFGIVCVLNTLLRLQYTIQTGLIYHYAGYILFSLIIVIHLFLDCTISIFFAL